MITTDRMSIAARVVALAIAARPAGAQACAATPGSMTPATWRSTDRTTRPADATRGLRLRRELPLPGPANRFDYQSVDAESGRIYMNHMDAGRTIVFDADSERVVAEITGVARATGVRVVAPHHQVYVSAPGTHEVAIIDDRTLKIVARVGGIRFPDGIAFAPAADKVFVSDESGGADVVIDASTHAKRATIPLGGQAGNTQYDSVSRCILVAVQTKNELAAIDPLSERIVQRYRTPGCDHPHGFVIDDAGRLAFVSCEENAALLVIDLRTMKVTQTLDVGDDPDVLAWDAGLRRLYVAAESGVVSMFALTGQTLESLGEIRAPHAHTVAVDPRTHRVYLPLENIGGRPVLRIYDVGR